MYFVILLISDLGKMYVHLYMMLAQDILQSKSC